MLSDWAETLKLQGALAGGVVGRARHATVIATDPTNHAVRVSVQPDDIVSGWVPDPGLACGTLRIGCPAEIGTQVLVVPVEGDAEHPVIVARLFDAVTVPPVSPATGQPVQPGEFGIFTAGGAFLHLSGNAISVGGALHVAGTITVTGDVVANGISLDGHAHGGVATGQARTGVPVS